MPASSLAKWSASPAVPMTVRLRAPRILNNCVVYLQKTDIFTEI